MEKKKIELEVVHGVEKVNSNTLSHVKGGMSDAEEISKDNQDGYPILCKELQERFSNKISVYPGFIRIHDENQTHLVCDSMEQKDAISFYEKLEDEGSINIDYYPNLCQKRGCVATCSTAYVVGPLGELYKCWNDMGNEEMIVGNIANEELIRPDLYNQYMVEGQWLSDDDCKKCFFYQYAVVGVHGNV